MLKNLNTDKLYLKKALLKHEICGAVASLRQLYRIYRK